MPCLALLTHGLLLIPIFALVVSHEEAKLCFTIYFSYDEYRKG